MTYSLTYDQKVCLKDDGYIVLKDAVPQTVVDEAKKLILDSLPRSERRLLVPGELATHPSVLALFYEGVANNVLTQMLGEFPPVISSQVAVTPGHDELGGIPGTHVDGGWSGKIPLTADEIDLQTGRPKDAKRYFGENDEIRGANDGLLWMNPERTLSCGSILHWSASALMIRPSQGMASLRCLKVCMKR